MNCENCPYCRSEYIGESYDEDVWCDKGFGDGYDGCNHILPYLQKFLNILTSPYYTIKLHIFRRKWFKSWKEQINEKD